MKKILSFLFTLFLITNTAFAFPNEPEGFRELKWGDSVKTLSNYYPDITLQKTLVSHTPSSDNEIFTVYKGTLQNKNLSGIELDKDANFIFYNNKFIGVILESNIIKPYNEFSDIYSKFFQNMTFLFGAPTEKNGELNQSRTLFKSNLVWSSNQKSIITVDATMTTPQRQERSANHFVSIKIFKFEFFDTFIKGNLHAKKEELKNQGW